MKKIGLLFVLLLFVGGCSTSHYIAPEAFEYKEMQSGKFTLASWQKLTDDTQPIKFYIEGDGAAFNVYGQPTRNPTPKGRMWRKLAFEDPSENVVYLARPCQFVKDEQCVRKYWTTARFAPEVIRSTAGVIKEIAKKRPVILIGFSGGAQVAGLVAVHNPDINLRKLITVAGNLDHKSWTKYHHVPDLKKSMSLTDYKEEYLELPQIHFVGTKDDIIPYSITIDFVGGDHVIKVDGATHGKGWENIYPQIWAEK